MRNRHVGWVLVLGLWLYVLNTVQANSQATPPESVGQHALPTLSAHTQEDYYNVTRWHPRQLQIPPGAGKPDGHPAAGLTSTALTLTKSLLPRAAGCQALQLSIVIQITITMPRWAGKASGAPVEMQIALRELRAHEEGHRVQAVEAGARLQQQLSKLPQGLNCTRLQLLIDQRLQRELFRLRMRGDLYDQRTDFGRKGLAEALKDAPRKRRFLRNSHVH